MGGGGKFWGWNYYDFDMLKRKVADRYVPEKKSANCLNDVICDFSIVLVYNVDLQ